MIYQVVCAGMNAGVTMVTYTSDSPYKHLCTLLCYQLLLGLFGNSKRISTQSEHIVCGHQMNNLQIPSTAE